MYGAAILFPGHPYIESATALSNNRCPCGPEDFDPKVVRNATRRCEGDFESGAEWGPVNDNECSEFGATARMLCNLALVCIYTLMYV